MHFIDLTGAMAAYRHSRTYIVTAAMDHIDFIQPVHLGDLVTLKSSVNRAFTTSMEVGVKVWAEDTQTGKVCARGQRLSGLCGHRQGGPPRARAGSASRRPPRSSATTPTRCCAASIARPRPPAASRRSWPTPRRKTYGPRNSKRTGLTPLFYIFTTISHTQCLSQSEGKCKCWQEISSSEFCLLFFASLDSARNSVPRPRKLQQPGGPTRLQGLCGPDRHHRSACAPESTGRQRTTIVQPLNWEDIRAGGFRRSKRCRIQRLPSG